MKYKPSDVRTLQAEKDVSLRELGDLQYRFIREAERCSSEKAQEHLKYGASRRLGVLRHSLKRIFEYIPPASYNPPDYDQIYDAQVNLYALINGLVGLFDNLAWAFAFEKQIDQVLGNKHLIDLFKPKYQAYLPSEIRNYLGSDLTKNWYQNYLKNYRDSLAHRIPPYIPPSLVASEKSEEYSDLIKRKYEASIAQDYSLRDRLDRQAKALEHPFFVYTHSFDPDEQARIYPLHQQPLCDLLTLREFCNIFLEYWRART